MPDTILDSLQTTALLTGNGVATPSTVDTAGDADWWRIDLVAGLRYRFNMKAANGSSLDSYLRLLDRYGTVIAYNDDSLNSRNSQIDYTATSSGTYYLSAQGYSSSTGAYELSAAPLAPVTLPSTVSIAATNAIQSEGDTGLMAFTFTVTRSSSVGSGSVDWKVWHRTTDAADFSGATSGGVSFAAGETSRTLTVQVAGDQMLEDSESFAVVLSAPTGMVLGTGAAVAVGEISNDDAEIVASTASTARVAVGGGSVRSAIDFGGDRDWWRVDLVAGTSYRFNMGAPTGSSLDSALELLNANGVSIYWSRNSQIDYTARTSGTYYLSTEGRSDSKGAYALSANVVTSTVKVETNTSQSEGNIGTKTFTFTIARDNSQIGPGSVNWAVRHGTTDAADFSGATSGVVRFATGEVGRTLTVQVAGDQVVEGDESFSVELSTPVGLVLGTSSVVGWIQNDDDNIAATSASTAALVVGRTDVSSRIDYRGDQDWWRIDLVAGKNYRFVMNGATDPFVLTYLCLRDANGVSLAIGDNLSWSGNYSTQIHYAATSSGTYFLSAQAVGNDSTGAYTLSATEFAPTVSITATNASQVEGNWDTRAFTFTVTRDSAKGGGSVNWAVRHSTTDAADFSGATSGVVRFAAGETSRTLTVQVASDQIQEGNESFSVELNVPTGLVLGTASAAGLIGNDDVDVGATTASTAAVAVGGSVRSAVDFSGDQDWWRVDLVAGRRYRFNMNAAASSPLDSYLGLRNWSGTEIAVNNDANGRCDSQIDYTASSTGTYYLSAQAFGNASTGAYALSAEDVTPTVSITATNASQSEGDEGVKAFTFTVTRRNSVVGSDSVNWAVRHGTTDAADFVGATNGVVRFAAGETGRTLTVQVAGNRMLEGNENFAVDLSAPTGLVLGTASAAGTVLNDDTDTIVGTIASTATVAVGGSVRSAIDYRGDQDWWRVNLVAGVRYRFNMQATASTPLSGYLELRSGSGTQLAFSDFDYMATSSGTHYLSTQAFGNYPTGAYMLSVEEITPMVSITATNASQSEGDAGTRAFTFTVTRSSSGLSGPGSVNWAVRHYTTNAADFLYERGVVRFETAQTSQTLTVQVVGDQMQEGNESFEVELSTPTGLALGIARAAGMVLNDDADTIVGTQASTATVAVGSSVSSAIDYRGDQDWWRVDLVAGMRYRFNMNAAASSRLDSYLELRSGSGTQLASNDDENSSWTRDSKIDYLATSSGTYYLSAQASGNYPTGAYTLSATEFTPKVSITSTNASQREGDAGTKVFTFTVTRSNSGVGSGTVKWAVRHGTTDAADFVGETSGVVSFAEGKTSQTLTVQVSGDQMQEDNESFAVELSMPTGLVLGTARADSTVLNDDTDTIVGSLASTATVAVGSSVSSAIDYRGDQDWRRVELVAGLRYRFNMNAAASSPLDSYLELRSGRGTQLAFNNDANGTRDSQIDYMAPSSGTYYLSTQGFGNDPTGAYTLSAVDVTPTVSITATNASQSEGNEGMKAFTFTVTRSNSGVGSGKVNWAVQHGTTDAADFVGATSGVVNFAAGETSRTLTVQVAGDQMQEGNESFAVELSTPAGLVLNTASAAGLIGNDDVDVEASKASTAAVAVGGSGRSAIDFSGDQDWWRVELVAGMRYRFNMNAAASSPLDSYLGLRNGSGTQLAFNNDANGTRDSQIDYTVTSSGTYYLSAQGTATSTGQYVLRVARILTGTAAADVFRFASANESPADISDFTSGSDRIQVVSRNFGSLPVGTLSSSRLVRGANPVATGTGAAFLYDTSTGQLTWDSNGALAGGTSVIANLGAGRSLVAGDIQVVAA